MAQNSSHDAPWLTNSKTEMFAVYAGNARSSCLVVGAVAGCSTQFYDFTACSTETSVTETVVRPWNEACPGGRRLNVADGDQCPSQVGCRQLGLSVQTH